MSKLNELIKETPMKGYIFGFFKKQLENFSSAKMLMFFIPLTVTAWQMGLILKKVFALAETFSKVPECYQYVAPLMEIGATTFISFCTFTVSLGTAILVCREVFKVAKIKKLEDADEIKNMGA